MQLTVKHMRLVYLSTHAYAERPPTDTFITPQPRCVHGITLSETQHVYVSLGPLPLYYHLKVAVVAGSFCRFSVVRKRVDWILLIQTLAPAGGSW
jgi:hypothetical protein